MQKKAAHPSDTYSTQDLMQRYRCSDSTIREKVRTQGFPSGQAFGREVIRLKSVVHRWEREYMPALHVEPEVTLIKADDEEHWARLIADKEKAEAAQPKREVQARRPRKRAVRKK